jgi:hypothetical protein
VAFGLLGVVLLPAPSPRRAESDGPEATGSPRVRRLRAFVRGFVLGRPDVSKEYGSFEGRTIDDGGEHGRFPIFLFSLVG